MKILKKFPVNSLNEVITRTGEIDKDVSVDGKGSLRIKAKEPAIVNLFEVNDIDVENARLIYQTMIRTKGVEGQVYLEVWCHFPGKGEFVSRGVENSLTGTTDWIGKDITFVLKKGKKPDYVRINVVLNGKGTVWIDDARLLKAEIQ